MFVLFCLLSSYIPCTIFRSIISSVIITYQLVGVIISTLLFDELLNNMFSDQVSGIDCVIRTKDFAVTYTIEQGEAIFQTMYVCSTDCADYMFVNWHHLI